MAAEALAEISSNGSAVTNWDRAGGDACPRCGQPSLRFLDGICPGCSKRQRAREARHIEQRALIRHFRKELKIGGRR